MRPRPIIVRDMESDKLHVRGKCYKNKVVVGDNPAEVIDLLITDGQLWLDAKGARKLAAWLVKAAEWQAK